MNSLTVKIAAALLIITISIVGVFFLQSILVPLLLAFLFAILLRPLVSFFNSKLKFPHVLAVLVTIILALLFTAGIVFFISRQVTSFATDIPNIKQNLYTHYHHIQAWVHEKFNISYRKQENYVEKVTQETLKSENEFVGNTIDTFSTVMLTVILIPVYTFLILLYRTLFITFLIKFFSEKHHPILQDILCEIKTVIRSYITGLLIEMIIIAILVSTGLMIIGVDYAIFIGVVAALLNLIPYIGIFTSCLLSMAVALGGSSELGSLLSILAVFLGIHLVDSNLVVPRIVSSKVSINALVSILGVVCGGALIGIPGMFLALPSIAILKVILDRVPSLEPWGYLLGNDVPKKFEWGVNLPDLDDVIEETNQQPSELKNKADKA